MPSLILLDLNTPIMNGRGALKMIKKDDSLKNLPVVILTTSSEKKDQKVCKKLGASEFVSKPPSFEELVTVLESILSKRLPKPVAA